MSLATLHYIIGGLLVLLCAWNLARFAAGAIPSRWAQGVNLATMLLLALEALFK